MKGVPMSYLNLQMTVEASEEMKGTKQNLQVIAELLMIKEVAAYSNFFFPNFRSFQEECQ